MKRMTLVGIAAFLLLASGASAQEPGRQHGDTTSAMRGRPMTTDMMMSMMDSADARLDRLVSTMNSSTGSRKVQAMAAVLNELVAQRKMMRMHARKMMMGPDGMMPAARDTTHKLPAADTSDSAQHHRS